MATTTSEILTRTTRATIEWASEHLDLSYDQIGSVLSVDRRTVHRWKSAESRPSRRHQESIERLMQIRYLLDSVFRDQEAALTWLHSPVPVLKGRTPLGVLKEGRLDEVIEALATIETGAVV